MDTHELQLQVRETGAEIIGVLEGFSEGRLNKVPFEGSWTAGQVAEHLLKSGGVAEVVWGRTEPALRAPDEKLGPLSIFLDMTVKFKTPDFIQPSEGFHAKAPLVEGLKESWRKIGEAVDTMDLSALCLDFEMPQMGTLTRMEWIGFYVFHTKRHLHQLYNISARLEDPENVVN